MDEEMISVENKNQRQHSCEEHYPTFQMQLEATYVTGPALCAEIPRALLPPTAAEAVPAPPRAPNPRNLQAFSPVIYGPETKALDPKMAEQSSSERGVADGRGEAAGSAVPSLVTGCASAMASHALVPSDNGAVTAEQRRPTGDGLMPVAGHELESAAATTAAATLPRVAARTAQLEHTRPRTEW